MQSMDERGLFCSVHFKENRQKKGKCASTELMRIWRISDAFAETEKKTTRRTIDCTNNIGMQLIVNLAYVKIILRMSNYCWINAEKIRSKPISLTNHQNSHVHRQWSICTITSVFFLLALGNYWWHYSCWCFFFSIISSHSRWVSKQLFCIQKWSHNTSVSTLVAWLKKGHRSIGNPCVSLSGYWSCTWTRGWPWAVSFCRWHSHRAASPLLTLSRPKRPSCKKMTLSWALLRKSGPQQSKYFPHDL